MNDQYPANSQPVIVVGAGPAGCTAALLLADSGIPVTLLERYLATPPAAPGGTPGRRSRQGPGPDRRERGLPGPVPARQRTAPAGRQAPRDGRVQPRPAAQPARLPAGQHVPPARPGRAAARPGRPAPADQPPARRRSDRAGRCPERAHRGPGPGTRPRRRPAADVHRPGRAGLRRRQQHDPPAGRDHHGGPGLHRALARGRHQGRDRPGYLGRGGADLRPGQAPPPSCTSPATGTAGSSSWATARTKPA